MSGAELVHYNAMCQAILQAYSVDEVKHIRDKALALQTYAAQARNVEAERQACEIRLRAERKAGQLLAEREKAKGGRPAENRSHDVTSSSQETLADLGISKPGDHARVGTAGRRVAQITGSGRCGMSIAGNDSALAAVA